MNKEQKQIFWNGALLALAGGVLGNLFSSLWTDRFISEVSKFSWGNTVLWVVFGIVSISFILFFWRLLKITKKISNIKRGRPRKANK